MERLWTSQTTTLLHNIAEIDDVVRHEGMISQNSARSMEMTSSLHCVTCVNAMEQNMAMSLGCVCVAFVHMSTLMRRASPYFGATASSAGRVDESLQVRQTLLVGFCRPHCFAAFSAS